jgi:hypothetical protein
MECRAEKQAAKNAVKYSKMSQAEYLSIRKRHKGVFLRGFAGFLTIFEVEHHRRKVETGIFSIKSGFLQKIPAPFNDPAKRHYALPRRPGRPMLILKLSKRDSPVNSMLIFGDSKSKGGRHE